MLHKNTVFFWSDLIWSKLFLDLFPVQAPCESSRSAAWQTAEEQCDQEEKSGGGEWSLHHQSTFTWLHFKQLCLFSRSWCWSMSSATEALTVATTCITSMMALTLSSTLLLPWSFRTCPLVGSALTLTHTPYDFKCCCWWWRHTSASCPDRDPELLPGAHWWHPLPDSQSTPKVSEHHCYRTDRWVSEQNVTTYLSSVKVQLKPNCAFLLASSVSTKEAVVTQASTVVKIFASVCQVGRTRHNTSKACICFESEWKRGWIAMR